VDLDLAAKWIPVSPPLKVLRTQAKEALMGLGWKPAVAVRAVDAALDALGSEAALERVIFEALRRCSQPAEH
jgi:Holliday junction resolvasome RuvABC DNA-binding subunit